MTDRPIIFSAPMIHPLRAGRKTQTRRVMRPIVDIDNAVEWLPETADRVSFPDARYWTARIAGGFTGRARAPYAVGDRLWVREAHAIVGSVDPGWVLYRASGYEAECARHGFDKPYPPASDVRWRPSIHMPRWASRITLTVTDVRAQRLQDISKADATAEGLICLSKDQGRVWKWGIPDADGLPGSDDVGWSWQTWCIGHWPAFAKLWDSIHGPDAWAQNPWVWAITFTVDLQNIDLAG